VRSFGQELTIERGKVFYAGGRLTNPGLDIRASREVGDLTAGVDITGTAKKPVFRAFSSDPHMKEDDARSLLLTGATKDRAGAGDASVYAGRNITDKLSVGTNISVDGGEKEFIARYQLNRKWSIKTTSSSVTSGAELLYTIKFK
jgi:translocation and assembly module TamB